MMWKKPSGNQTTSAVQRPWSVTPGSLLAAAAIGVCGLASGGAWALTPAASPAQAAASADETEDVLVFANGKVLKGTIVSETAKTIKFKGLVSGIAFESEFEKKDITSITRATKKADGKGDSKPEAAKTVDASSVASAPKAAADAEGSQAWYWIKLSGKFGRDISQTPLRQAIRDAKANNASTIIIELDADELKLQQVGHEAFASAEDGFASVFRAEPMTTILTDEMPREWDSMPRIVTWVKRAEGGAAFLPFACPNIYFHPDGKIGGLGGLTFLFGGQANERVYEKQVSLRLGHAEGILLAGGYDDRLVRAMAMHEYVLTLGFKDGKPVLYQRMPENPGEELLTDDANEEAGRRDGIQTLARGTGNDVLTLDSRLALLLGVSKGEVSTKDELLTELGLDRDAREIKGRSDRIMKDWRTGLDSAERQVRRILDDYQAVEVEEPGGYTERTKARGRRTKLLNELVALLDRWEEALDDNWRGENRIPSDAEIKTILEQIKLEQMVDRK